MCATTCTTTTTTTTTTTQDSGNWQGLAQGWVFGHLKGGQLSKFIWKLGEEIVCHPKVR